MAEGSDEGSGDRDDQKGCAEDVAGLVRAALSHDREAFGALCVRFERAVFLTVYRLVGNEADALDVLQNTLMRSYRGLNTYDVGRPFRNWLLTIAVNEARSLLRRRRRRRFISLHQVAEPAQPGSAGPRGRAEQVAAAELRDAMGSLPVDERTAFVLRYVESRSPAEVANLMDVSARTVRRLCRGARDRLRKLLRE